MSRRDDADRTSSYSYADRRDGERSGHNQYNSRVRSPLRENSNRDRNRDWERNFDREHSPGAGSRRYSADVRKDYRDSAPRRERHPQNGGSSPPRGPTSNRQQEPPRGPGLQRSATAPNLATSKIAPGSKPTQQSPSEVLLRLFRNIVTPVADRTILKRQKQEVEKAILRRRMEFEKGASKHNDFPSVRDTHLQAVKKLDQQMGILNKELDQNNNILNSESKIWLEKLLELATQPHSSHPKGNPRPQQSDDMGARLDALEKKILEKETTWAEKEASWAKQQDENLARQAKQADRVSALENDMTAAKKQIQSLSEENSALKAELQNVAKEPAPEVLALATVQGLQALVDTTRNEVHDLTGKVDEAAATLADLDVEFVNESCGDINVKLPALQNSVDLLRAELGSRMPAPDTSKLVTTEQYEQSLVNMKGRQNAIAVRLGNMVNELSEEMGARVSLLEKGGRQSALSVPAPSPPARSGSAAPELWDTEARARAIEEARQRNSSMSSTVDTGGSRNTGENQDAANRLQALEIKVQAHEDTFVTNDRHNQHERICTDAVEKLLQRNTALEERCSSCERSERQIRGRAADLEGKVEKSEKLLNGKFEAVQHALNVLDSQYNNLSTEGLAQTIGGHIHNQDHETVTRLQHSNADVIQLVSAMDRRVTGVEQALSGRSLISEVSGNGAVPSPSPVLANGTH